jgi:hypothetical protein
MTSVPSAERYGFHLELNDAALRALLNSSEVRAAVAARAEEAQMAVVASIEATADSRNAQNYVASMFTDSASSDEYGFDFDGPFSLGDRPVSVVGVRGGRGADPGAKPPMLIEAEHHALTSVPGFTVGGVGEDIR